jgi:outer membrane autotransporter protein
MNPACYRLRYPLLMCWRAFRGGRGIKHKGLAASVAPMLGLVLTPVLVLDPAWAQTIDGGGSETVNGGGGGTQPSPWSIGGTLTVGNTGSGSLTIENGGIVSNASGRIGSAAGSTGTATVTGAGSTWTSSVDLSVGQAGSGTLTIEDGGTVSNMTGRIGFGAISTGTATVTGAGSTWTNSKNLFVGNDGDGTLTIEDGGTVSNIIGNIAYTAGSTGTATVTGAGSTWTSSADLIVGDSGDGTLTIEDGGTVNNSTGRIGSAAGSTGTATVTGAGSTWTGSSDLFVGRQGSGTLTIEGSGTVNYGTGRIGFDAGSTGTATVTGAGSTWTNSFNLFVGSSGDGTLTIEDGGTVSNTGGQIGFLAGSTGTATVTGAGSTWTSTGQTIVGDFGNATLTVADGGLVTSQEPLIIGNEAGSTGRLNIGAAEGNAATAAGTVAASSVVFGQGDGRIVFNHTNGAYTFAGDISGNGRVEVLSGTTILSGTNSYTGGTAVKGGRLSFNGNATSSIEVQSGGILGGSGTVGAVSLLAGSSLAPGNSIGTLNTGDVNFASGSSYDVEIDSAGRSDLLNSSGNVTIASGVTLNITPETIGEDGSTYANGTDYTVITANSVAGTFDTITDSFIFLDPFVRYDAANVYLRMVRNNTDYSSVARTPNQLATSQAVTSLGTASSIYQAVAMLDAETARSAFDQVSGEIHASSKTLLFDSSRLVQQAAHNQSNETGENAWIRFLGGRSIFEADGNAARSAESVYGFFAGLDLTLNDDLGFGLMAGRTWTNQSLIDRRSSGSSEGLHMGGYGSASALGLDLGFSAVYSNYDLDTNRSVSFGSFSDTLSASYDASTFALSGEVSRSFETSNVTFMPFAGLSYTKLSTSSISETGGAAALSSGSSTQELGATTLGLRASHQIEIGTDTSVRLQGSAGWQQRFGDIASQADLALAGQPTFSVRGVNTPRHVAMLSAGIELDLGDNTKLMLDYNGEIARRSQGHRAEMNINWKF